MQKLAQIVEVHNELLAKVKLQESIGFE
jgi:hypothetical protein